MAKKQATSRRKCIVCGKTNIVNLTKDEILCKSCGSQYPTKSQPKVKIASV